MEIVKLALLGFGNAGQAFARLLTAKNNEIESTFGKKVLVVAISTKTKGTVVDEKGLDLLKLIKEIEKDGSFSNSVNMNSLEIANNVEYDILVELTPLNIFSGQPAINHIKTALLKGRHVITANKGPVAWAYRELKKISQEKRALFYCETTVMDGTPIFNLLDYTLPFCKVTQIEGILNTTTNFVLEEMAKGNTFDDSISEGKKRGFVEADSSADIEGWDSAAKLAALINVMMDGEITPIDVERKGIEGITQEYIKDAESRGKVVKLICRGGIGDDGAIYANVKPEEIDSGNMLASVDGTSSVVSITTDLMGKISITEHNPEIEQTGYGIFSDLIRIISSSKKE